MTFPRASGILLHPTSLPSPYGIGDLGPEAYRFADWLAQAGQHIWQVLPLGPVGYGESPYQLFSAFAGNPSLISLDKLLERGLLDSSDLAAIPDFRHDKVEFERVVPWKENLLQKAFSRCNAPELDEFRTKHATWLPAYTRFMALKAAHGGKMWTDWPPTDQPDPQMVCYHEFLQFEFFRQWCELKDYGQVQHGQVGFAHRHAQKTGCDQQRR